LPQDTEKPVPKTGGEREGRSKLYHHRPELGLFAITFSFSVQPVYLSGLAAEGGKQVRRPLGVIGIMHGIPLAYH